MSFNDTADLVRLGPALLASIIFVVFPDDLD